MRWGTLLVDRVEIVPATLAYAARIGNNLREADRIEVERVGLLARRAVKSSFRASVWSRVALVDGVPAAIWGITGSFLGEVGRPWLLTTPDAKKISPLAFARIYRGEVVRMLASFQKLENAVDASYTGAVRLLELTGFTLSEPFPFGESGAMFRLFQMEAV